jgi:hypothetical protein
MSQNPNKRNKDTKEMAEENIDEEIDNEDPAGGEEPIEEVAGQRDAKGADDADSSIINQELQYAVRLLKEGKS